MKSILIVLVLLPALSMAQPEMTLLIQRLQDVYAEHAENPDPSVSYHAGDHILDVSGYAISASPDTEVRAEGKLLKFYCQNRTQIFHRDHPGDPHAQLVLPMKDRRSAKQFARMFRQLSHT